MTNTQNDCLAHVRYLQTLGHCPACTDDSHADGNDPLTKAIAALGAVEVAPGRYAVLDAVSGWMIVPERNVESLYNYRSLHTPREALTLEDLAAVLMPRWWTPETQYAIRNGDMALPEVHLDREQRAEREARGWFRITADLTTGEEVPA